jgi:hypothetical protein
VGEKETDADDPARANAPSETITVASLRNAVYRLSKQYPCRDYGCGSLGYEGSMG